MTPAAATASGPGAGPGVGPGVGPSVIDALALLSEVAGELVVASVRDTHLAVADRVGRVAHRATGGASTLPDLAHRSLAGAVYGGLAAGLRATSTGLDRLGATGAGPRLEDGPRGRLLSSTVNGLIGDRLARERPHLAIPMAVRAHGRDVDLTPEALSAAHPRPSGRLVVFLHGLCENESCWDVHRDRTGRTYGEALAARGWTPVLLRANTGLSLRENGVALAALMQRLVDAWPVPVTRVALVGHSLGGLVARAAGAVATVPPVSPVSGASGEEWTQRVTDVVTLGTPHLGSPIARGVGHGSRGLSRLPETAAFGRILDWRSVGVHDLVAGLAEDVPPLPHARYRLVAATLTRSQRHPVGHVVGDLLVRPRSAYGRDDRGGELFPGAEILHVGRTDHFGLLNHPDVHAALERWLA